jgi:hypothetical protein
VLRLQTCAALRHREFRLLWAGQAATAMAMWMDQVARGWLLYELTNSPVQLGLVHGVQAIPLLVLSPVADSVADRYPRKQQVVVAQGLAGVLYTVLALLSMTGHIQPWHVYATAFGMAIIQAFHRPARAAMVADAVPPCHLTNAIGLTSIMFNVARSTGPALAGVLIATLGTASCYVVQTGCYLLAVVWTLWLRPTPSAVTSGRAAPGASFGQSIVEGWTFSWRNEAVRTGLLIAASPSFRLSLGLMTLVGLAHVSSYVLVQTVIQTYSPSAFRGRTMAIFHLSEVVVTLGSMLAGTLAALVGARWAAAAMGAAGALLTVTIGAALPHARRIR